MNDQELEGFFNDLKRIESKKPVPDIESLLGEEPEGEKRSFSWKYVAAIFLIGITSIAIYFSQSRETSSPEFEIIISYVPTDTPSEDEFDMVGMDQWQSETDILLIEQ